MMPVAQWAKERSNVKGISDAMTCHNLPQMRKKLCGFPRSSRVLVPPNDIRNQIGP